jgi:N-acyl-D-amino-acid deacylase
MTKPRSKLTRREALTRLGTGVGAAVAAEGAVARAQDRPAPPAPPTTRHLTEVFPVTGKAGPGLEGLDEVVLEVMEHHGIPGAALTIALDGRLILAKGYGWSDVTTGTPTQPDTRFGLASLSKPITATAVLKLVEAGKLGFDDRVFDLLKDLKPPRGTREDPRYRTITVRQCLNHSAGWNRDLRGDPITWTPLVCRGLGVPPPLSAAQLLSFLMALPLDYDPGTECHYSNVGYIALGEVIAAVTGQPYGRWVLDNVLKPAGAKGAALEALNGRYLANAARRHLAGTLMILPPIELPMQDASGGWVGSAIDMMCFLTALDGSRGKALLTEKSLQAMIEPPPKPLGPFPDGTHVGLGWDKVQSEGKRFGYFKSGNFPGERTFSKRRADGLKWVLLFNASMDFDPQDGQRITNALQLIHQKIERYEKYPDLDLFKDFT